MDGLQSGIHGLQRLFGTFCHCKRRTLGEKAAVCPGFISVQVHRITPIRGTLYTYTHTIQVHNVHINTHAHSLERAENRGMVTSDTTACICAIKVKRGNLERGVTWNNVF